MPLRPGRLCSKCKVAEAYKWLSYCRSCFNIMRREKYQAKEVKGLKRRRQQVWIDLKSKPCTDCGNVFPWQVMEFDHVPGRGAKIAEVNKIKKNKGMSTARAEIEKCDLLCPTCHRIRTWKRQEEKKRQNEALF